MRPDEFDAYLRAAEEEERPNDMLRQLLAMKGV